MYTVPSSLAAIVKVLSEVSVSDTVTVPSVSPEALIVLSVEVVKVL